MFQGKDDLGGIWSQDLSTYEIQLSISLGGLMFLQSRPLVNRNITSVVGSLLLTLDTTDHNAIIN